MDMRMLEKGGCLFIRRIRFFWVSLVWYDPFTLLFWEVWNFGGYGMGVWKFEVFEVCMRCWFELLDLFLTFFWFFCSHSGLLFTSLPITPPHLILPFDASLLSRHTLLCPDFQLAYSSYPLQTTNQQQTPMQQGNGAKITQATNEKSYD